MKKVVIAITALLILGCSSSPNKSEVGSGSRTPSTLPSIPDQPFDELKFMHSIYFARYLPQQGIVNMGIDDIVKDQEYGGLIKDAVFNSLKSSILPLVVNANPALVQSSTQIHTLAFQAMTLFSEALREELKKIKVTRAETVFLTFGPRMSKLSEATYYQNVSEIPISPLYSKDKFLVYENLPSMNEAYPSAEDTLATVYYKGIGALMQDQYERDKENPFFISMTLKVQLDVDTAKSQVISQVLIGMPVNKQVPFTQANDQIQFENIAFPQVSQKSDATSEFPVALMTMKRTLEKNSPPQIQIEFGPVGATQKGKWARSAGKDFKSLVPKLQGKKGQLKIDFNVYNLNVNLDTQTVSDLDLFISVGLSKFGNFRVGNINKPDIDSQFETEINKSIKEEIKKGQDKLDQKVSDGTLQAKVMDALLKEFFTIKK